MRCLVLWADNHSANLGVRALAQGTAQIARQAFGSDISLEYQNFEAGDSAGGFNADAFLRDVGRPKGPIKQRFQDIDLVLDTGAGDSFTDSYGWKRLLLMNHVRRVISRKGLPIVMTPQTIGPFSTRHGRIVGRAALRGARVAIARDSASAAHGHALTGLQFPVGSDVVFALPVQVAEPASHDLILNVSGLLWTSDRFGDPEKYRALVRAMIREFIATGVDVTLLPHVLHNETIDDDTRAVSILRTEFGGSISYVEPESLDHARSIIAGARLLVGSRMHACLNAISQGVPAFPIAYSRKFASLFQDLGWTQGSSVAKAVQDPMSVVNQALALRAEDHQAASQAAARGRANLRFAVETLASVGRPGVA